VPPPSGCPNGGPPSPEVTGVTCRVPSTPFSQAPGYAQPVHLCRFRVRSVRRGCFLDPSSRQINPIRPDNASGPSPPAGRGMFASFPSTTAFALALGAGSPCADEPCAGTLGLSATGSLTLLIATHVSMCASDTSSRPRGRPSQAYGTLRYRFREQRTEIRDQTRCPRDLSRPCSIFAIS
jgi:hypothetical protein